VTALHPTHSKNLEGDWNVTAKDTSIVWSNAGLMLPSKGRFGASRCRCTKDAAAFARALPQPGSQAPAEDNSQEETGEGRINTSQCLSHITVLWAWGKSSRPLSRPLSDCGGWLLSFQWFEQGSFPS